MRRLFIVTCCLCLLAYSCKKDADKAPGLSLQSPLSGQDVATDDSLLIEGTATDNDGLHEFYLTITNAGGDTVLYNAPYVHNLKSFAFKYYFTTQDTGDYHARIDVIDHDLNLVTRQFELHASLPPVLTLSAPADSTELGVTDSLYIAGNATHNISLKNLRVLVISYTTADTAFTLNTDLSNLQTYNFANFFHPVDTGWYFVQARVTNYKDEPALKSKRFHVHQ